MARRDEIADELIAACHGSIDLAINVMSAAWDRYPIVSNLDVGGEGVEGGPTD